MSVYKELINLDKLFRQLTEPPVIVNDLSTSTESEREALNKKLYTVYDSGIYNNIASCDCGEIKDDFNIGVHCHVCDSKVTSPLYHDLEPLLWIRAPDSVNKLINPDVWRMITQSFVVKRVSLVRWLCDTSYNPSVYVQQIEALINAGIQRGYNYFVDNFDRIMNFIMDMSYFNSGIKRNKTQALRKMLLENKDKVFCDHLPLPNRVLLVIEDTNMGKYVDFVYFSLIEAVQLIVNIDTVRTRKKELDKKDKIQVISVNHLLGSQEMEDTPEFIVDNTSVRSKENRTVRMMEALSDFYVNYYRKNLAGKPGILRKHLFSSRANFSFRAVITSITEPHEYNEIHAPWTSAVGVLRFHILNKLKRRGFGTNAGLKFINTYARKYHPMLDEIFKELISESVHYNEDIGKDQVGIPITLVRNPGLGRGSCLRLRITQVLTNPEIWALRLSILSVVSLNAWLIG